MPLYRVGRLVAALGSDSKPAWGQTPNPLQAHLFLESDPKNALESDPKRLPFDAAGPTGRMEQLLARVLREL